jgi:hypothetical protein
MIASAGAPEVSKSTSATSPGRRANPPSQRHSRPVSKEVRSGAIIVPSLGQ